MCIVCYDNKKYLIIIICIYWFILLINQHFTSTDNWACFIFACFCELLYCFFALFILYDYSKENNILLRYAMVRVSFVHFIFHFSQRNGKKTNKTSENLIYLYKPNIEKGIGFTVFCLKGRTVRTQKQSKFNFLFVFCFQFFCLVSYQFIVAFCSCFTLSCPSFKFYSSGSTEEHTHSIHLCALGDPPPCSLRQGCMHLVYSLHC